MVVLWKFVIIALTQVGLAEADSVDPELLWEQAAIGEEIGDASMIAKAYHEISKLMEDAGSWAAWYGPAKARQYLQKAIEAYSAVTPRTAKAKAGLLDCSRRLTALDADTGCSVS